MVALRHLGRSTFLAEAKRSEVWSVSEPEQTLLADLSGSSLVQNLSGLSSPPPAETFALVTPSGGVETPLRIELEKEVLRRARLTDGGCLWASSGSDAMEMALWVADAYFGHTSETTVKTFLVRRGGYHGNTYLTRFLSTRGGVERPLNMDGRRLAILEEGVAAPGTNPLLEALIEAETKGLIVSPAALVLEPLPTTGLNFWLGDAAYGEVIRWCRERDILIIFDEIASGAYRHGRLTAFAWGQEEAPDISLISKGLTCGTFPISCAIFSPALTAFLEARRTRPLSFTHGLSDPAAWLALEYLRRYDSLFASRAYSERRDLIAQLAHDALAEFAPATVEHSETTLRLNVSATTARAALSSMESKGLWAYAGFTDFPPNPDRRGFIHLCPPIDLPVDHVKRMLTEAVDLVAQSET